MVAIDNNVLASTLLNNNNVLASTPLPIYQPCAAGQVRFRRTLRVSSSAINKLSS